MGVIIAIFIGGGLGSLARYGVAHLVTQFWRGEFPLGTFVANLLSCIVMGAVVGLFYHKITTAELKALILIGFCGGFSTFSTFGLEFFGLINQGRVVLACCYVGLSLLLSFFIFFILAKNYSLNIG